MTIQNRGRYFIEKKDVIVKAMLSTDIKIEND